MNTVEYRQRLETSGLKVLLGSAETLWVSHERFSMLRLPACALGPPTTEEIRTVFRCSNSAVLSYTVLPSGERPANAVLYLCRDSEYNLDKLGKNARYDVRRGLKEFDIRFIEQHEVLELGKQAYTDTLGRAGLSAAHREKFEAAFGRSHPGKCYLGAIREGRLAAFLQLVAVNDWVSLGGYSANEFLSLCPNNALVFFAARYYLSEKNLRVIDYGLSSVQAVSNARGLDHFKQKMGFEAVPVHRAFIVNPLLRPFVNRFSSALVNSMLKLSPQHTLLKKAEGALRMVLEGQKV